MNERQIIEWILVGILLADESLRETAETAFVGEQQLSAARSINHGKVPDVLYTLKPDQPGETLRESIVRKLAESAAHGRLRYTLQKLAKGESLRISLEQLDQVSTHIKQLEEHQLKNM